MQAFLKITLIYTLLFPAGLMAGKFSADDRFRIKESELFYHHTAISYAFLVDEIATPYLGVRFIQKQGDDWNAFTRFFAGVNLRLRAVPGKLTLTSAFEYRPGSALGSLNTKDEVRYRQRAKYMLPFSFTPLQFSPFIYDEFFFRASEGFEYYANRLGIGLAGRIGAYFKPELNYYRAYQRSKKWQADNVFELVCKVVF